ncbi:MAG TPA: CpsD/CapB family tyrosine-protein kinase, partial [Clostridia bacterium]|nr:CpsD/CapB family tyrosine-protein kinase [Clostridia bacterium]
KVVVANTRIAEAERLKINVQRAQSVYERLAMLVQNVAISRNIDQETLTVLEKASAPKRTFTQEISIVTMAGFGGLGTGLGIILLIAWRDDRFNSIGEITKKLATNVIGQLPDVQKLGKGESDEPLLQLDDRRHAYAESYRTLRSALLFMTHAEDRPRVILITSAVPNEGKSTVAANLARTLAQGGSSVVLIDADMRKGVLHHLLKLKREPGLADVLRNPALLDEVIQTHENLSFSAISSGRLTGNAGDLLLGPAVDTIIKRLREQFEYVIIDSSPIFAADDTSTLAPRVDGTLFVVRSRYSGARLVREALDLLHQRQARVLGVVFNRANASSRSYYYYKYAEYYPADNAVAGK